MTALPEPLRSFWYELDATEWSTRTPWGMVFSDPRFPLLYDANHAAVLEEMPDLDLEEIRRVLRPAIGQAGAEHEQIEFWASQGCPAARDLRLEIADSRDVIMVFDGHAPAVPPSEVEVREIASSDPSFPDRYRESGTDLGERERMEPNVLAELYHRDVEVFVPRGLRLFIAMLDGHVAGRATLMRIGAVGYVDTVVTRLPFRRRGVATAAVLSAVQAGIERGDEVVHLLTVKDSYPQRLYERLGFRVLSEIVTFTQTIGPAEDGATSSEA